MKKMMLVFGLLVLGLVMYDTMQEKESTLPATVITPDKKIENVASSTMALIGDSKVDYSKRLEAVTRLSRSLSEGEKYQIKEMILDPKGDNAVRNDLLTALEKQRTPVAGLGALLLDIWHDENENSIFRNYAIQHMGEVYLLGSNTVEIRSILIEVAEGDTADAGTALLSLQRIGKQDQEIHAIAQQIAAKAVSRHGKDPETAIVGIQMATENGDRSILKTARALAPSKNTKTRLRMSAIAALGSLGTQADAAVLKPLIKDANRRVRQAAKMNLEKLKKRLNS